MSDLHFFCITSNDVSPINKKRLFILHHPANQELMRKKAKHLAKLLDCAVYYLNYGQFRYPDADEFCSLLNGMDIVVPFVTEEFLDETEEDDRYEGMFDLIQYVFRYVKKRHIPMMPLMIDEGLEKDFDRICGKIHFLQNNESEHRYLTLDEKIKNFYDQIIHPVEEGEPEPIVLKNRIFISYRRKDKDAAKKLIDLVKNYEDFYDVGLWYDELLTVGFEYDNEIKGKIANSTIMLMYVTNNIFGSYNYVKDEEYPAAKGKIPIIPIYDEPFDKDKFNETFPDLINPVHISECIDEIKKHLVKENRSIGHDIEVAKAYLYGDGVIKSVDKAESILLKHKDNIFVVSYLASIYRGRFGYKYDLEKAIVYQKILSDKSQNRYPYPFFSKQYVTYVDLLYSYSILSKDEALSKKTLNEVKRALKEHCEKFFVYNPETLLFARVAAQIARAYTNKQIADVVISYFENFFEVEPQLGKFLKFEVCNLLILLYEKFEMEEKAFATVKRFDDFLNLYTEDETYDILCFDNFSTFTSVLSYVYEHEELKEYSIRWRHLLKRANISLDDDNASVSQLGLLMIRLEELTEEAKDLDKLQEIENEVIEIGKKIKQIKHDDGYFMVRLIEKFFNLVFDHNFFVDVTPFVDILVDIFPNLSDSDKNLAVVTIFRLDNYRDFYVDIIDWGEIQHNLKRMIPQIKEPSENVLKIQKFIQDETEYILSLVVYDESDTAIEILKEYPSKETMVQFERLAQWAIKQNNDDIIKNLYKFYNLVTEKMPELVDEKFKETHIQLKNLQK